jgi:hypothetical protein
VEASGLAGEALDGPETLTAAMTLPAGERTGADTDATPASRSATDWAQPRRRTVDSATAEKEAFDSPRWMRLGFLPGQQHLGRRASVHGELCADRDRVAQTHWTLCCGGADAEVALAAEELGGFAGDVTQARQDGPGGGQQTVFAGGGGEFGEAGAEHETSLQVAADEAVVLQGDGEAVGRGAGQPGGGHQAR